MSWRSTPAIPNACWVTSSTIWVSVTCVQRTDGTCPYPTIATSTIRTGRFRYGVPATRLLARYGSGYPTNAPRSGRSARAGHASAASPSEALSCEFAHVDVGLPGRHPSLDAAVGAAPATGRELV